MRAGFTPADVSFSNKAEFYKREFEKILNTAVELGDGIVRQEVLDSGELITEFTAVAEKQTENLTGIPINRQITNREQRLSDSRCKNPGPEMHRLVRQLNKRALELLDGFISFKKHILERVLKCEMFTMNYPLLIEHILREAKLYREYVAILEEKGCLNDDAMYDIECFWNQIMMEHALFIRGLLDPSESDLICAADGFAKEYSNLLETCRCAHNRTLTASSLNETLKFREFKTAGTKGITECGIRSLILPLLADHVLREANHFIRLLTI